MATEKSAPTLSSIRTLATDQARSQKNTSSPAPSRPAKAPEVTIVGAGESRNYQAPTAKKSPVPTKVTPPAEKPSPTPPKVTPVTLKPLVGPKKVEETALVVDNEDAASATIIRDTTVGRFRLFPAIRSSLITWFSALKEHYFTKKAAQYTVPETTHRKGVIQKATSKTGKLATFDNGSLQARIKEREVKTTPKEATTIWTANTEPGYALLEAPETTSSITNVQIVPRRSLATEVQKAAVGESPAPAAVASIPTQEKADLPNPTVEASREGSIPEAPLVPRLVAWESEKFIEKPLTESSPKPTPAPAPKPVAPEPVLVPTPEPIVTQPKPTLPPTQEPVVVTTETVPAPVKSQLSPQRSVSIREWLFSVNTNLVALAIAGIVLFIVGTSVFSYHWFNQNTSTLKVATVPNHPTYITAPLQTLTTNGGARDEVFSRLISNQQNSDGRLLLFAFTREASGETLIEPQVVMSTLNFSVSTPFARSLNALYFGVTESQVPFLLLKTTDKTTAFGGMLNWEASLYSDLLPMLTPAAEDLQAGALFRDVTVDGRDVRALVSETGETLLVYNQPIDNIIIIAPDQMTLSTLLSLIP